MTDFKEQMSTTRKGVFASMAEAPSAAAFGVGSAWIGGNQYWLDGAVWTLISSSDPSASRIYIKQQFGCVADGVTNEQAKVQAAFDAAAVIEGELRSNASKIYAATAAHTTSGSAPTHSSGTVSQWEYVCPQAVLA